MSFADIRAHIETKVDDAFGALAQPPEIVWDNVQDTPPALPYVVCTISYTDTTIPVLCQTDGAVEQINGNLQLAAYAPRGRGMKALEEYAAASMQVMNSLYDWGSRVKVKAGPISGPVPLLAGDQPYAMVNVSCAFMASVQASID